MILLEILLVYALGSLLYGTVELIWRGWTWYTGSAAWLYDVYLRDFLGFDKRGNEVTLRPILPADWEECTVLYHFGASRYHLTAAKDTLFVTLDGARVRGEYIPLKDDGRTHEARFPARK